MGVGAFISIQLQRAVVWGCLLVFRGRSSRTPDIVHCYDKCCGVGVSRREELVEE